MQTVVSVFEDRQTAQRAVDRLIDAGFDRERVHLQEGAATANIAAVTSPIMATIDPEPGRGVLSSIGHFLASLFNEDQPAESKRYAEAVRRGRPVVVVDARDAEQANRASAIARELGAFDIDEHYALWQGSDMSAGTSSSTGVVMPG